MLNPLFLLAIFFEVLILVSPVEGNLYLMFPWLLLVLVYSTFVFCSNMRRYSIGSANSLYFGRTYLILYISLLMYMTDGMVMYYTGNGILESYIGLLNADSNYNSYQTFFKKSDRHVFSFIKIYYTALMSIVKLSALYGMYAVIFHGWRKWHYLGLLIPMVSYCVGRGTSVEIFEIFLMLVVSIYVRSIKLSAISKAKLAAFIAATSMVAIALFVIVIQLRYQFGYSVAGCDRAFCYDQSIFPEDLSFTLFLLTNYMLGGFLNINNYFLHADIFYILLPMNILITPGLWEMCSDVAVRCGSWKPVLVSLLEHVGLLGALLTCFLLGCLVKVLLKVSESQFYRLFVVFFSIYLMYSIFVGEGVFSSNANIFMLILVVFRYFILNRVRRFNSLLQLVGLSPRMPD